MDVFFTKRQNGQPGGMGGNQEQESTSISQLLATLLPSILIAIVWLVVFLMLRPVVKRYYQPRSFIGSLKPEHRSPQLSDSKFGWFSEFWKIPDTYVLNHHTLDGFLFLRFLKICVLLLIVGCFITMPILFPVNATGSGTATGIDILGFGHAAGTENTADTFRYFAHAGCAIIFFGFILYLITRESIYYINLRQAYLLSPFYSNRISSRTVLFASVPEEYMNEARLRETFDGVRQIWLAQDVKELEEKVKERDSAAMKLEGAETKMIRAANGARLKSEKKGGRTATDDAAVEQGNGVASRWLKPKDRPTHKTKPLIGKKVDTIDWCRNELKRLIPEVDQLQAKALARENTNLNSVFIEFGTVSQAQTAFQSVAHHQALHMSPRFAGVHPDEVIWGNLRIKWWERVIRKFASTAATVALIIFWAIPVAAVGAISNINYLISIPAFSWLSFINKMPPQIKGVITGLLPTVLFAVLLALVPIILRLFARLGGAPTRSAIELSLQSSFFWFYVIQGFLVVTLGASASAVADQIRRNPGSAPSLLAQKIPSAANFYFSYFSLQGLAVMAGILVGLVGLVLLKLLGKFLDSTPRKMYNRWINLSGLTWGSIMPVYTTFAVISIIYAVIQPLVMIFGALCLAFFYFAYRYNLLYVSNVQIDTKGRIYPRALKQLLVGVYIAEVTMIGLFAIRSGSGSTGVGATGPLVLMVIMLIFTILYHSSLNSALQPLIDYLPKNLESVEHRLQAAEHGEATTDLGKNGANGTNGTHGKEGALGGPELGGAPHKKPGFLAKFLKPHIYNDYQTMRRLVPTMIPIEYAPEVAQNAYFHPAIVSRTPLLWIPRDTMGISKEEVQHTQEVIPITDEGAYLGEKNNIVWDAEDGRPPIYEEKPYY